MPDPTAAAGLAFSEREGFITIGNFRHPPNWDAVLWLKHYLWPLVRERLPGAQLRIYGAYQPAKATALHNPKQGFHLRSEEHTSELQSRGHLVCRLLLEKKNKKQKSKEYMI